MATKRWQVTVDTALHDVEVRTGEWTGAIRVLVDGAELRRGPRWREDVQRIVFPLGRRLATLVWTRYGRANPQYDLVFEGRSITTGGQPRPPEDPGETLGGSLVLFVLLLMILLGVLWFGALPEIRLAVEGREVPALVTGGRISTGRSTSHYLQYVFVTADGPRATEGKVSFATYRSVRPNDVITVVYVPSAPEIQRPTSLDDRIWIALLVAMFAPMLAATMAWAWRAHRRRAISAALTDRAIRTTAIVEKVTKGWTDIGMRRIEYRYDDAEGRSRKGTSPRLFVEEASAYTPGSTATVAYDQNDPGNSVWLGASDPKTTVWVT